MILNGDTLSRSKMLYVTYDLEHVSTTEYDESNYFELNSISLIKIILVHCVTKHYEKFFFISH